MAPMSKDDPVLARLAEICLALPETTREATWKHSSFLTRNKTLLYWLDDHHGDGIVGFAVRVAKGKNAKLVKSDPKRYFMPAYIGARGWVGYRMDVKGIDWDTVADLVIESWRSVVPAKLAADDSLVRAARKAARAPGVRGMVAKLSTRAPAAEAALDRVRKMALAFPRTEEKLSHGSPSFFVKGKMFMSFVDDHHGDGRIAVWIKSTMDDQKRLVKENPEVYFVPPYVGVSGWVGARLDRPKTDWIDLAIVVEEGWRAAAPKSLAG